MQIDALRRIVLTTILLAFAALYSASALGQTNYYEVSPTGGNWDSGDTSNNIWATPNLSSTPLTDWVSGTANIANIDNEGQSLPTLKFTSDITAQSLVLYATTLNTVTSAAEVDYDLVSNDTNSYNTLTLAGGTIVQDFAPSNTAGAISTEIDANVVAGSSASPTTLTVTGAGTYGSPGAASFGDTTLNLTGVNTFTNLHIGGAVASGAYNTVAIGNSAGLPLAYSGPTQTSGIVYFDGNQSAFAVDSPSSGAPVTLTAGNFVISNTGTYSLGTYVVGVGATAGNTLIINGGIIGVSGSHGGVGQGDVQFSTGFSGTLDTDGDITDNGTGLVILNGQSSYAGQTRFNAGISPTVSGTKQAYVRLGINNALPTTTDLIMSFTTGNGGNFDLYGFNQTVGSISTTVLNSPSVIFNSGGASGTTPSTLTISGSDSPGPFNDAIDDADPNSAVNSFASPGTSAPLTLVRAGTGTTILTNTSSTYSGGTQILGGTLSINADAELGSFSNASVPENVIISGGTLAASGSFILNPNRTVAIGAPGSLAGTISVAPGSILTYSGTISDYSAGGPSGTGGLVLTGGGTLSLGGANTYTGPTQVNQGNLNLGSGGSLTSSSAVTVASTGTLSGFGTANGSVAMSGTIAPGSASAVGTLTVGSLALNGGGSYTWMISDGLAGQGAGWDLIDVVNSLTLNNTSSSPFIINAVGAPSGVTNFDNTQADSWTIATAGSAIPAFNSNIFTVNSVLGVPGSSFTVTGSGDNLMLNYNPGSTQFLVWKNGTGGSGMWNTADSDWTNTHTSTTGTWENDGTVGAEFASSPGTVTLATPISTAAILFQANGYAINGTGTNTLTTSTISVGSLGSTATINAQLVGGAFTKSGAGTLVLTNPANTFSSVSVGVGTLQGNVASLDNGNITVGSGSTLVFDEASASNETYSGSLSGSGSVIKQDSGKLALSGNNSGFTGAFDVTGGTLSISADAASGSNAQLGLSVPLIVKIDGGTLQTTAAVTSTRSMLIGSTGTSNGTLDVDGQNVTFDGGTQSSPSATIYNGGTFTITDSAGGGSLTILPSTSGHGANTGNTYGFQSSGGDGMIDVVGTSLILGNNTDFTGNFEIMNTAFGGSSATDNGLTLQNGNLTIRAGAQAGASPILQSLNIIGNSSITLYRVDTASSLVALFSQTNAGNPTTTGLATDSTPLALNGGSTLTIVPGGNTQNATTNYIGFGSLILNGNATIQAESNQTTGIAGSATPTLHGVDTTLREETGVFNDNGYTTTFYGQLTPASSFLSTAQTTAPFYGPATQFGFVTYTSGFDGVKQNTTGYWVISNPAGTQGISVSLQGTNIFDLTSGNVLINPYGALFLAEAYTYGVPGQVININGLGSNSVAGALVSNATGTTSLSSTISLGTVSVAQGLDTTPRDAIDATAGNTFTLSGNLTGAGTLVKEGGGNLIIDGIANTATGGTQIGNGTLTVGDGNAHLTSTLGTGSLSLAQTTTSSDSVVFANTAQTISTLSSSFSDNASSASETQTIALNGNGVVGTVLTINETTSTTFGNNGYYTAQKSSINGPGSIVLSAASTGTLTFNGQNTYTGGTTINGGTLELNFAAVGASGGSPPTTPGYFPPTSNILAPTGPLAMGGGTLLVNGATSGSASQTVASLAVNQGASTIVDTSNGNSSSLTITSSTISRTVGGTLDFTLPTSGNISFSSSPVLTGGILGGWATVGGGASFATVNSGNVSAYSGATSISSSTTLASGTNYDVAASLSASGSANSLRFTNTSTAAVLSLSGIVPITTGGILVPSTVTSADSIAGGTLEGAAGADLVVIQNNASTMTISSTIADNGSSTGLTKSGSGTLALNSANTYSGTTTINAGTLRVDSGGSSGTLGSGAVVDNATLSFDRGDTAYSVGNLISGNGVVSQVGVGTTTFTAANTYTGQTSITSGVVQLGNADAVQNSTVNVGVVNGLAFAPNIGTFTIGGLTGSGGLNLEDPFIINNPVTLQIGNNNANTSYSGGLTGSGGITKIGNGTLTLSGASNYLGTTAVNGGTLRLDFTAAGAPGSDILPSGSAMALGGGSLVVNGAASGGGSSQTVASLTVNQGDSKVVDTSNSGVPSALVITGSSITRNLGGTVDFTPSSGTQSGTNGIVTTASNSSGILGGWATVGGTDWATVSSGNIVAYSAYTNDTWAAGANTTVTQDDTPASGSMTNSLRFGSTTTGNLVTLQGTGDISSGGILISSAVTAATTVTGGTLEGPGGGDLIVINNSVSNFTLSSVIADNGTSTGLTKSGPGTLVLGTGTSASNTFTGGVYINQGAVMLNEGLEYGVVPSGNVFSGNLITFGSNSAGTTPVLNLNLMPANVGGLISATSNATVEGMSAGFTGNTTLTITGAGTYNYAGALIDGGGIGLPTSNLALTISGTGTQILSGTDTYGGATTINSGTLQIGNGGTTGSLGTGNVTDDSVLTFDLSSSPTIAVPIEGTGQIYQIGTGTTTFTASNNTYSNGTFITSGTLATAGNGVIGPGPLVMSAISGASATASLGNGQSVSGITNTTAVGGTTRISIASGQTLTSTGALTNTGSLNINASTPAGGIVLVQSAPTLNANSSIVVNSGELEFNLPSSNPATVQSGASITVAPTATLLLAGSSSALSQGNNASNIDNHGSTVAGGGFVVTGSTETVGVVSGTPSSSNGATVYDGDTTDGDGSSSSSLTASQILQNSLTINAGSTVVIEPASATEGGVVVASSAASPGNDSVSSSASTSSGSTSDGFAAIESALDSNSTMASTFSALRGLVGADPAFRLSAMDDGALYIYHQFSADGASSAVSSQLSPTLILDLTIDGLSPSEIAMLTDGASGDAPSVVIGSISPTIELGTSAAAVPEPSTSLLLLVLGATGFALLALTRFRRASVEAIGSSAHRS